MNNDSDIRNLNSKIEYKKEEKIKVQKKFFLLVVLFITIIFLFIIFLLYFENIKKFFNNEKNISTEVEEEDFSKLYDREDGSINTNDDEIQRLFSRLYLNYNEYFIFDSNLLYTTEIENFNDKDKLFLISKTEQFYSLVDKKDNIYTKEQLCNTPITISEKDIEEIAQNNLNVSEIKHTTFIMSYVKNNVFLSYMEFKPDNGKYVGACINYEKQSLNKIASNIIYRAEKEKNYIYIDIQVIFRTEKGVYKDFDLTKLISTTYNEEKELNYYSMGSKYRVYYKYNGNKDFYLEKITLIN